MLSFVWKKDFYRNFLHSAQIASTNFSSTFQQRVLHAESAMRNILQLAIYFGTHSWQLANFSLIITYTKGKQLATRDITNIILSIMHRVITKKVPTYQP